MPYITPDVFMQGRFEDHPRPEWKTAVLCFRDIEGSALMVQELGAQPLGYQVLTGMEEFPGNPYPFAHELTLGPAKVGVIARCGWGGPQTAMLVEELAYLGVTRIIGIGAAGSIDHSIPKGSQIIADPALTTDGTSQAYTCAPVLKGDALLCSLALAAGERLRVPMRKVCAVTTDALYRETEVQVAAWRARGGQAVNMESAPFYAASETCSIRSLWIGHVSDCLIAGEWEEWSDIADMTVISARLGLEILTHVSSRPGQEIGEA